MSVPAFGDWDQKQGGVPDYSIDFSKIREMRKQNKKDISRLSVGNDDELINPTANQRVARPPPPALDGPPVQHRSSAAGSPSKKEKILRFLNCCVST
ncbi:uncharacterized protein LOC144714021 isoform X2 [Wolffia australiana]